MKNSVMPPILILLALLTFSYYGIPGEDIRTIDVGGIRLGDQVDAAEKKLTAAGYKIHPMRPSYSDNFPLLFHARKEDRKTPGPWFIGVYAKRPGMNVIDALEGYSTGPFFNPKKFRLAQSSRDGKRTRQIYSNEHGRFQRFAYYHFQSCNGRGGGSFAPDCSIKTPKKPYALIATSSTPNLINFLLVNP